jgi:hypothetical protein
MPALFALTMVISKNTKARVQWSSPNIVDDPKYAEVAFRLCRIASSQKVLQSIVPNVKAVALHGCER